MRTHLHVKRRDFLRSASAAGALSFLSRLSVVNGFGGTAETASSVTPPAEEVMARLDAIAREFLTIPKAEGKFLNLLIKLTRARRVLEVGTGYGYTTIWFALALEETGGKLTTIEIVPERVELAKKHVEQAGLSQRVTFKQGDAHAIVPTLTRPFDVAYLDADKGGQVDYFNKLFPKKLPPGSLLVAHNAILLADKMRDFLALVGGHPAFQTLIVRAIPDDGFALSYRQKERR